MHLLYRTRRGEMLAFLRDGLLVRQEVIDPAFLDHPYDPSARGRAHAQRMLAFVAAESWVRNWAGD